MYRKAGLLVILTVLLAGAVSSQMPINTLNVDRQTYTLLLNEDWDALIALGNSALSKDIDFYYLRYRMGIAWYKKANYHKAIPHLNKAYETNPSDALLKEYLYYANLFVNRKHEARIIAASMTASQKKQLGIDDQLWLEQADLSYQYGNGNTSGITDAFLSDQDVNTSGTRFISKDHHYWGIGLLHPVKPGLSVYHAYSNIRKRHFFYSQSENDTILNPDAISRLNQYYISGIIRLARNLELIAGVHLIHIGYPVDVVIARGNNTFVATETISSTDYVGVISVYRHLPYITLGGSMYYAGLNNKNQFQGDAMLVYYPLGNLNLYSATTLSIQSQTNTQASAAQSTVLYQRLGGQLVKGIWLEGFLSVGDMNNFLRHDGLVVYNAMDVVSQQLGAKWSITLSSRLGIDFLYTFSKHRSSFVPDDLNNAMINNLHFNSHSITGGLIWTL